MMTKPKGYPATVTFSSLKAGQQFAFTAFDYSFGEFWIKRGQRWAYQARTDFREHRQAEVKSDTLVFPKEA